MAVWSLLSFLALGCSGQTDEAERATGKSEELYAAITETRHMDSCRMKAQNRDFYLHKYKAESIIEKYRRDNSLSPFERKLLTKACGDIAFASTDYLLQVGKYHEARNVMDQLASNTYFNIHCDTALWLNFLYHQSKVYHLPYNISRNRETILKGYDCATQAYMLANRANDTFFKAQSLQILSKYLINDSIRALAEAFDRASIRYINEDEMPDSLLAGNLAERSLRLFLDLNDAYHTADAWRNLASCYFKAGDYTRALECLNAAIANPATAAMPDLLATINEQFSMAYAAVEDKYQSDLHRNAYLDLQDSTRQDRELEARVVALRESADRIWQLVTAAVVVLAILCAVTAVLVRRRKRWQQERTSTEEALEAKYDELHSCEHQYSEEVRAAVEQRARTAIINGLLPLIDRMRIAIDKGNLDYAAELAEEIEAQNEMLTRWIKLRQGAIQPRIETFPLQSVLDVIGKNIQVLRTQGITLDIPQTKTSVKADHTLTLFIINTLVDNARKAVGRGGRIAVTCTEDAEKGYAEVCVSDNGPGIPEEKLEHLFEYKPTQEHNGQRAHGFGLPNSRGIIDRYRKISPIFSVCAIFAESVAGKGTELRFRLPLALKTLLCAMSLLLPATPAMAHNATTGVSNEIRAAAYCDSLYKYNVEGRYETAMLYADSCLALVQKDSTVDISIKLSLYNETAIAALALHQWDRYRYYNYKFTTLYKEATADPALPTYCQTMERNELTANVTMLVMTILIAAFLPLFWFTYLRYYIRRRNELRERAVEIDEQTAKTKAEYQHLHLVNNITANQLSTLKHETMYYPGRISRLIKTGGETADLIATVDYYRELYTTLSVQILNGQTATVTLPTTRIPLKEALPGITAAPSAGHAAEDCIIIANKELTDYLKVLLKRHNGGKSPSCVLISVTERYATVRFYMDASRLTAKDVRWLFSPSTPDADYLIMRQIMRETGNNSIAYGTGITATMEGTTPVITVTFPIFS